MAAAPAPVMASYWQAEESGAVREFTVGDPLQEAAATVPGRPALVDAVDNTPARRTWTYAELLADTDRVVRALLARFSADDRIAIWAPNSADSVVLQQAIGLAGMVLVPVDLAYRARELEYVLRQSGAVGLFHIDPHRGFDLAGLVEELRLKLPGLRAAISFAAWESFAGSGDRRRELPTVAPTDLLQIQYTSGTTGFPKGALLHHFGLINAADPVSGEVQPLGEPGEICCRSYQNMMAYYDMPEETAPTIDADGWLHMGDLGTMDERGFVRVTGRIKDMIYPGRINPYPREIEEVLLEHPAVAEAAVVGVPDENWDEQIAAIIRLVHGVSPLSIEEIRSFGRSQMSAHKTPSSWSFTDQLPATPSGRVQKLLLREQLASGVLRTHTHQDEPHPAENRTD